MKKSISLRIIVLLLIPLLFSIVSSYASNTVVIVDGSGSVAGMSKTRPHNSIRTITAELTDYLSKLSAKDTVSLIHFTDRIQGIYTYAGYTKSIQAVIDSLRFIPKGNTDFSVALNALDEISRYRRVIIISDGLNNSGPSNDEICNRLKQIAENLNGEVYFLLLNEADSHNQIIQFVSDSENISLVRSLSDIPSYSTNSKLNNSTSDSTSNEGLISTEDNVTQASDTKSNSCCTFDWKYVKIVLIVLLCIAIIALIGYLIYQFGPLFFQASAGAMQRAICLLYNLPNGLFNIVFKILPESMRSFLAEAMPKKEVFNVGKVIPSSEQQAKALEAMQKETGKAMRYKNGEIDFKPVSKFQVKLKGSLDKNIPETLDPRSKVFKAQEAARDQMLKSKKGRSIIGQYVGKSPKDITVDDYTCWKDDMLNFGKPNHNPLTPHETIDGKYMQWVPKKYHDVTWGGFFHHGGVSLLKSIRNYLAKIA